MGVSKTRGKTISELPKTTRAVSRQITLNDQAGGPTESQILAEIRKAANYYPDLVLWRLSQGGAVARGGHTYRAGLSVNGASDLIGIYRGRFVAIEVKSAKGRVSEEQTLFMNIVRTRGGYAAVCRSVDEFHAVLARIVIERD